MNGVLIAVLFLLVLGLLLGLVIGVIARFFALKTDPRVEQVEDMLPQANCGACGYAGCAEFAKALVHGEATPDMCPVSSSEEARAIADALGVSLTERVEKVAVVRCGGDNRLSSWGAGYNGVLDCRSANLIGGGVKECSYGCLGLGSCARACPFGAIEITPHGLAVVHPDICTGCGKCVPACPRNLIELVPRSAPIHNLCNNPQKGAVTKKFCKVSCIGCAKCVKNAEKGRMYMDGALARVNYDDPPDAALAEVCPTKCLQPSLSLKNTVPALQDKEEEAVHA